MHILEADGDGVLRGAHRVLRVDELPSGGGRRRCGRVRRRGSGSAWQAALLDGGEGIMYCSV